MLKFSIQLAIGRMPTRVRGIIQRQNLIGDKTVKGFLKISENINIDYRTPLYKVYGTILDPNFKRKKPNSVVASRKLTDQEDESK